MVDRSHHALHKFAPTLIVGCSPTEAEPAAQSAVDRTEKPSSVTADTLANKAPNPEAGLAKLNVGPTLKLLEPGEAPRKLLRHVFSERDLVIQSSGNTDSPNPDIKIRAALARNELTVGAASAQQQPYGMWAGSVYGHPRGRARSQKW